MKASTVRDLGAHVRAARHAQGLTQADLAERLNVSRDWVVRLEKGHPRLEAQRVLDAFVVLGLTLDVSQPMSAAAVKKTPRMATKKVGRSAAVTVSHPVSKKDPFDVVFRGR